MSVHFFFFRYLSLLLFLLDTRASFGINCYYHVVCDQLARAFCDRLTWARMFHLNLNGIWLFGWIESSTHIHKVTQLHSHTETGAHMPGLLVAVTVNKLHTCIQHAFVRCRRRLRRHNQKTTVDSNRCVTRPTDHPKTAHKHTDTISTYRVPLASLYRPTWVSDSLVA